ncbi:hypothetical protein BPY_07080 [Bifidobacterium psychraerophilum]
MSIARREAEDKYAGHTSGVQQAYVTGRTAEPTEVEIFALALKRYGFDNPTARDSVELRRRWDAETPRYKSMRLAEAKELLEAARKAVTGDE